MNATANLKSAAATLRTAEAKLDTAQQAAATHSANVAADERRLADLLKLQASHLVAVAVGEIGDVPAPDAAEIQRLRDQAGPNAEASRIFQGRIPIAERASAAAREIYLTAVRAHLTGVEEPPLRQRLAATLERLGVEVAALMGLEDALRNEFAKPGGYNSHSSNMERFVREFAALSFWRLGGKDLLPSWLGDQVFRPWDIPGVEEARIAVRLAVERASA